MTIDADEDKQQPSALLDAAKAAQRAEATKTARRRALRLAKEAADRLSQGIVQVARRKRHPRSP